MIKSVLLKVLLLAIVAVIIIGPVATLFFQPRATEGTSMQPTICDGDFVILNMTAYLLSAPKRGDLVSIDTDKFGDITKRIIGLPGETVEIKGSTVYIDEEQLNETYIGNLVYGGYGPVTVPEDHYFVLGDNRLFSADSRDTDTGMIPAKSIKGRVSLCLWPIDRIKLLATRQSRLYND